MPLSSSLPLWRPSTWFSGFLTHGFKPLAALFCLLLLVPLASGRAQAVSLIRDAEIEYAIRLYSTPLFRAAGLTPSAVEIYLVNDPSLNAFVTAGNNLFINTGLLIRAEDPLQVIGVIAHETGHMAGGHSLGRGEEIRNASIKALAAQLLAIGAAVASGSAGAAAAVSLAGQDVALKSLLAYTRGQEQAADQAGVKYLNATETSPRGLLEFMEILEDQDLLLSDNQDPYLRTHPLTRERVDFLAEQTRLSPYADQPAPPEFIALHARVRAKLIGFLSTPQQLSRYYDRKDRSLPARYARAISAYQQGLIDDALLRLDSLMQEFPNDPFFHELRGQILLEHGRVAEALPDYQIAADLRPNEPQLLQALARTQVELNQPDLDAAAEKNLQKVVRSEPYNSYAWRLLSTVYSRQGEKGLMSLALAEMYYAQGAIPDAHRLSERALKLLPENSPPWYRASDVQTATQNTLGAKKNN
ncbi:M48 family metalloprotease [Rhodovibrionaceae bacterium A322]